VLSAAGRRGADTRSTDSTLFRVDSVVSDAEKHALRDRLLVLALHDAAQPVALQLCLLVARIARFDHPREWCVSTAHLAEEKCNSCAFV
jgi:hypothetical protein